ncbi:hypothetical protein FIM08_02695 [SAR202 cluster bacterium AC-647-N09_OGT_505m]|nr:hypothetical protein [SAR202 cluster bacterium AC-647-N09_OGT_505m]
MFKAVGCSKVLHGLHLALEVSGLGPSTIRHYISDTKKVLEYYSALPTLEITQTHIRQYLALLKYRLSAKTVYELQLASRKFFGIPLIGYNVGWNLKARSPVGD